MNTARLGPTPTPPRIHIGDLTLTLLDGGHLLLDGGAMFGIIPKPLWSRLVHADEQNRIPLATTCFLLETGGKRILVESGVGSIEKFPEKERGFFGLGSHWIGDSLSAIGVERESIDYVVLSHLHFDHCGGCTMPDGRGGCQLTFPRARHIVQQGEWDDAVEGHAVMTGTYRPENLQPLGKSDRFWRLDGDAEIVPGVCVTKMPGHTRHQQGIVFADRDRKAVMPADMMPTSAHAGLRYNMAYDLMPYENMCNKERFLADAVREGWTVLLGQDPANTIWRAEADARGRAMLVESAD